MWAEKAARAVSPLPGVRCATAARTAPHGSMPVTGLSEGRPLIVRTPDSRLTLGNLMRAQVYGAFGTLSLGMRILTREGVEVDALLAHGGLFRTAGVAQLRDVVASLAAPGDVRGNG